MATSKISVSVRRLNLAKKEGTVKAFADIDVNGIGVDGFRVLDNGGDRGPGIGLPNRVGKDSKGVAQYYPTFHADEEVIDAIRGAVVKAYEAKLSSKKA